MDYKHKRGFIQINYLLYYQNKESDIDSELKSLYDIDDYELIISELKNTDEEKINILYDQAIIFKNNYSPRSNKKRKRENDSERVRKKTCIEGVYIKS